MLTRSICDSCTDCSPFANRLYDESISSIAWISPCVDAKPQFGNGFIQGLVDETDQSLDSLNSVSNCYVLPYSTEGTVGERTFSVFYGDMKGIEAFFVAASEMF